MSGEEQQIKQRKKTPTSEVLKASATDFCENTSLHGFSYWISAGSAQFDNVISTFTVAFFSIANMCEKLFWVIIVATGLILASILLNSAIDEWINNPTGISCRLMAYHALPWSFLPVLRGGNRKLHSASD